MSAEMGNNMKQLFQDFAFLNNDYSSTLAILLVGPTVSAQSGTIVRN